ncbi:MAG TPA: serpin family protein, partial [Acidothermaceae bacterium]|nr:serpin family protein [Acidothermaceae bacterium]
GLIASCAKPGSTNGGSSVPTEVKASDVARAEPGSASTTALVEGITAFGHDLYAQAATGGNVVYSPLSIAVALSMARAGAGGTTASQIDTVMHFPADQRDAAMNALTQALATQATAPPVASPVASRSAGSPPEDPILTIANGLFVQQGQPIGAPFLQTLAADYGTGVHTVNFASSTATDEINAWVRTQTAQRIQQLFDSLDPSTRLVLANAVYLKADWAIPFAEQPTSNAAFTKADGTKITVPTMHQSGTFGYVKTDGWQAVSIPYAGNTLAMWVIVPTGSTPLASLLAPSTMSSIATELKSTYLTLSLPRWKSTTNLDLGTALQSLGMTAAFSPHADFSGIYPGLFISKAVHRATITVDEWGTEAAAVTGLAFAASARMAPSITVNVDHPFAYAIVSVPTNAVVFEGSVADPTAD